MKTDVIKMLDEWLYSIMYAYYRKLVQNLIRNTLLTLFGLIVSLQTSTGKVWLDNIP